MRGNQLQYAWRFVQPAVGFAAEITRRHYRIVDQIMLPLLDPARHHPISSGLFGLECIIKLPLGPIDPQVRGELYWAVHDIQSTLTPAIPRDFLDGWRTVADSPGWKPPDPKDATERTMRMVYVACDLASKAVMTPTFIEGQQAGHHMALVADMLAAGCGENIVAEMLQRWRLLDAHGEMPQDAAIATTFAKWWDKGDCVSAYKAVEKVAEKAAEKAVEKNTKVGKKP